jgi:CRISPR-associated protein Cas1
MSMVPDGLKVANRGESNVTPPPYLPFDHVVIQRANGYLSLPALNALMGQKISVSLLDWQGKLLGQFVPYARKSGDLWMRQFRAAENPKKRLALAKAIVAEGYKRRGMSPDVRHAASLVELRHAEANAAFAYWVRWKARLAEVWPKHDFDSRVRPDYHARFRAVNQVNAVLNYAYSLLEATARTMCHRVGLHPEIGFLHSNDAPDKEPMVYDLQEYGRAWVDEAVLAWLAEPEHRRGTRRTDEWVVRLEPETARSLVSFVAPFIRDATLWRDARSIVKRLMGRGD